MEEIASFATENKADLRPVSLNILEQSSINTAVTRVFNTAHRLDSVIHNAGHMNWGFAEAFTPEQYLQLYDVNVVGCQRLNQAVLPHFRAARRGHLIWVSSSSAYGGKGPMLGAYSAAKAAMDSLARTYAWELQPWCIATTVVTPGVFQGTAHFRDAAKPRRADVQREYEMGPTQGVAEQAMKGTQEIAGDASPSLVADALVQVVAAPEGQKPFRVAVDPTDDGCEAGGAVIDEHGREFMQRMGLGHLNVTKRSS